MTTPSCGSVRDCGWPSGGDEVCRAGRRAVADVTSAERAPTQGGFAHLFMDAAESTLVGTGWQLETRFRRRPHPAGRDRDQPSGGPWDAADLALAERVFTLDGWTLHMIDALELTCGSYHSVPRV